MSSFNFLNDTIHFASQTRHGKTIMMDIKVRHNHLVGKITSAANKRPGQVVQRVVVYWTCIKTCAGWPWQLTHMCMQSYKIAIVRLNYVGWPIAEKISPPCSALHSGLYMNTWSNSKCSMKVYVSPGQIGSSWMQVFIYMTFVQCTACMWLYNAIMTPFSPTYHVIGRH